MAAIGVVVSLLFTGLAWYMKQAVKNYYTKSEVHEKFLSVQVYEAKEEARDLRMKNLEKQQDFIVTQIGKILDDNKILIKELSKN